MDEKLLEQAYRDGYCRGFAHGNAGRQWKPSEGPLLAAWGDFQCRNADAIRAASEPLPYLITVNGVEYVRVVPAPRVRGDSGTADTGRCTDLESGV